MFFQHYKVQTNERMVIPMPKICSFAGHSRLSAKESLYEKLLPTIEALITNDGITEFWAGNYGDFDRLSASAVRTLKEKYPEIRLVLVVPYLTSDINEYRDEYSRDFDEIVIADMPENTPKKLGIIKANQYMVNNSEILLCFIEHSFGGAAKTLEYAKKKGVRVVNLAE